MGINVGLTNWPTHDVALMAALESFALANGRRWDNTEQRDKPLDAAWWREATKRREIAAPPFGLNRGYSRTGEMVAWAIEDFLKQRLHLQDWLNRGHRMGMALTLVPFAFGDGARGEPPWVEIRSTNNSMLIGNAPGFVTYWDGGYEDDGGRAYRADAAAAFAAISAPGFEADDDAAAGRIHLGLEFLFYELLCAGWDRALLVSISF